MAVISSINRKRIISFILVLFMTVSLIGGCSRDDTENTGNDIDSSGTGTDESGGTATPTPEPTNTPTPEPTPPTGLSAQELDLTDYSDYSSESLSWWYRRPGADALGQEDRDTIDIGVQALVDPFEAIYQDPSEERRLYLTFDAGYEYGTNTATILDILEEKGVSATFFITGAYIDASPDVVKRMLNDGHMVANHTLEHKNPVETLANEGLLAMAMDVEALATKFQELTDVQMPRYLRPGQGVYSEQVLAIYADMGYRAVFWDFAYADWMVDNQPDPAASLEQVTGEMHPGSVILLHAVSNTNVEILPAVLDFALANQYSFHLIEAFP